jgi:N-acetyl-gamma-glutamyl-phosphate reductase
VKYKVFIDGESGTTGLRLRGRLEKREDIVLLKADPEKKKDPAERKRLLNESDVSFLCLPDAASREAVGLIDNPNTRVIDSSTAFRCAEDWTYGFPEL